MSRAPVSDNFPAANPAAAESSVLPNGSEALEPLPRSHEEHQYLDLIREILDQGEHRPDRTGTGTYSIFAPPQLRFALCRSTSRNEGFEPVLPLLTTKRVFLRAVVAELLWFISGDTSSTTLSDQNVRIWDGNGSREFLDKAGLSHRAEGDLGPVYGFQWRHFGAEYKDATSSYKGQGVDQLAEVVRKLKSSPFDRRIILSAWNPADLGKMALPPCHMFAQFYVSFPSKKRRAGSASQVSESEGPNSAPEKGVLHTILYQRSCDMGLGIPFNIASYALLTHMLAHACDLVPGSLTHTMGDAHVYLDHIDALKVQLERDPRDFPTLEMPEIKRGAGLEALESWKAEDFVVKDYNPHKAVPMKMSV